MPTDATVHLGKEKLPARVLETPLEQMRGFIGQRDPPDHAAVFPYRNSVPRLFHMVGVATPLDAVFVVDGRVSKVTRMRAWTGFAFGRAELVVEIAAGAVDVSEGDDVEVVA